jgi:hypothetical protein
MTDVISYEPVTAAEPSPVTCGDHAHSPAPERLEPVKDDSGATVPLDLQPVFGSGRGMFHSALSAVLECKLSFLRLAAHPAALGIPNIGWHLDALQQIELTLRDAMPAHVCDNCDGEGCPRCGGLGWTGKGKG